MAMAIMLDVQLFLLPQRVTYAALTFTLCCTAASTGTSTRISQKKEQELYPSNGSSLDCP
jgi:hypothetical protein